MRLPRVVPSSLGPVPIVETDKPSEKVEACGSFDSRTRVIRMDPSCTDVLQLVTLGHEMAHMALYDSGAANFLTSKITEAVCDAFGLWFGQAVLAGFIKVDANWQPPKRRV